MQRGVLVPGRCLLQGPRGLAMPWQHQDRGMHQWGHSGDGWQQPSTVLQQRQPVPTPFAEQLLVHGSQTSVQAQCSQKMVCTWSNGFTFPLSGVAFLGKGTGHTCGQAAGQHLQGCQVLGSLGAEAFHNPIPLHAIKKEVVRRVPLRQGLKGRQGPVLLRPV